MKTTAKILQATPSLRGNLSTYCVQNTRSEHGLLWSIESPGARKRYLTSDRPFAGVFAVLESDADVDNSVTLWNLNDYWTDVVANNVAFRPFKTTLESGDVWEVDANGVFTSPTATDLTTIPSLFFHQAEEIKVEKSENPNPEAFKIIPLEGQFDPTAIRKVEYANIVSGTDHAETTTTLTHKYAGTTTPLDQYDAFRLTNSTNQMEMLVPDDYQFVTDVHTDDLKSYWSQTSTANGVAVPYDNAKHYRNYMSEAFTILYHKLPNGTEVTLQSGSNANITFPSIPVRAGQSETVCVMLDRPLNEVDITPFEPSFTQFANYSLNLPRTIAATPCPEYHTAAPALALFSETPALVDWISEFDDLDAAFSSFGHIEFDYEHNSIAPIIRPNNDNAWTKMCPSFPFITFDELVQNYYFAEAVTDSAFHCQRHMPLSRYHTPTRHGDHMKTQIKTGLPQNSFIGVEVLPSQAGVLSSRADYYFKNDYLISCHRHELHRWVNGTQNLNKFDAFGPHAVLKMDVPNFTPVDYVMWEAQSARTLTNLTIRSPLANEKIIPGAGIHSIGCVANYIRQTMSTTEIKESIMAILRQLPSYRLLFPNYPVHNTGSEFHPGMAAAAYGQPSFLANKIRDWAVDRVIEVERYPHDAAAFLLATVGSGFAL